MFTDDVVNALVVYCQWVEVAPHPDSMRCRTSVRPVDRSRLIGKRMARRRSNGIGALSSPVVTVPSSVVEDEPIEIAASEMAPARHGSYGDCDLGSGDGARRVDILRVPGRT